jgi:hypothetical protein
VDGVARVAVEDVSRLTAVPDPTALNPSFVMPGFMPGIHVLKYCDGKDVDGWDKPGHDGKQTICWL